MAEATRLRVGFLLRLVQEGESIPMPYSRTMAQVDGRCHELRVREADSSWRVIYTIEPEAVVVLSVFRKQDQRTPKRVREQVQRLLREWRR